MPHKGKQSYEGMDSQQRALSKTGGGKPTDIAPKPHRQKGSGGGKRGKRNSHDKMKY